MFTNLDTAEDATLTSARKNKRVFPRVLRSMSS